jgi:hypothetical protein
LASQSGSLGSPNFGFTQFWPRKQVHLQSRSLASRFTCNQGHSQAGSLAIKVTCKQVPRLLS